MLFQPAPFYKELYSSCHGVSAARFGGSSAVLRGPRAMTESRAQVRCRRIVGPVP